MNTNRKNNKYAVLLLFVLVTIYSQFGYAKDSVVAAELMHSGKNADSAIEVVLSGIEKQGEGKYKLNLLLQKSNKVGLPINLVENKKKYRFNLVDSSNEEHAVGIEDVRFSNECLNGIAAGCRVAITGDLKEAAANDIEFNSYKTSIPYKSGDNSNIHTFEDGMPEIEVVNQGSGSLSPVSGSYTISVKKISSGSVNINNVYPTLECIKVDEDQNINNINLDSTAVDIKFHIDNENFKNGNCNGYIAIEYSNEKGEKKTASIPIELVHGVDGAVSAWVKPLIVATASVAAIVTLIYYFKHHGQLLNIDDINHPGDDDAPGFPGGGGDVHRNGGLSAVIKLPYALQVAINWFRNNVAEEQQRRILVSPDQLPGLEAVQIANLRGNISGLTADLTKERSQVKELRGQFDRVQRDLSKAKKTEADLQSELAQKVKNEKEILSDIERVRRERDKALSELDKLRQETRDQVNVLQGKLDSELKNQEANKGELQRKLENQEEAIKKLEQKLKPYESQVVKLNGYLQQVQVQLKQVEQARQEEATQGQNALQQQKQQAELQVAEVKKSLYEVQERLDRIQQERDGAVVDLNELRDQTGNRVAELEEELKQAQEQLKQIIQLQEKTKAELQSEMYERKRVEVSNVELQQQLQLEQRRDSNDLHNRQEGLYDHSNMYLNGNSNNNRPFSAPLYSQPASFSLRQNFGSHISNNIGNMFLRPSFSSSDSLESSSIPSVLNMADINRRAGELWQNMRSAPAAAQQAARNFLNSLGLPPRQPDVDTQGRLTLAGSHVPAFGTSTTSPTVFQTPISEPPFESGGVGAIESMDDFLNKVPDYYAEEILNADPEAGPVMWAGDIDLEIIANHDNFRVVLYSNRMIEETLYRVPGLVFNDNGTAGTINLFFAGGHYQVFNPSGHGRMVQTGMLANGNPIMQQAYQAALDNTDIIDAGGEGNCLFYAYLRARGLNASIEEAGRLRSIVSEEILGNEDIRNSIRFLFNQLFDARDMDEVNDILVSIPHGNLRDRSLALILQLPRFQRVLNSFFNKFLKSHIRNPRFGLYKSSSSQSQFVEGYDQAMDSASAKTQAEKRQREEEKNLKATVGEFKSRLEALEKRIDKDTREYSAVTSSAQKLAKKGVTAKEVDKVRELIESLERKALNGSTRIGDMKARLNTLIENENMLDGSSEHSTWMRLSRELGNESIDKKQLDKIHQEIEKLEKSILKEKAGKRPRSIAQGKESDAKRKHLEPSGLSSCEDLVRDDESSDSDGKDKEDEQHDNVTNVGLPGITPAKKKGGSNAGRTPHPKRQVEKEKARKTSKPMVQEKGDNAKLNSVELSELSMQEPIMGDDGSSDSEVKDKEDKQQDSESSVTPIRSNLGKTPYTQGKTRARNERKPSEYARMTKVLFTPINSSHSVLANQPKPALKKTASKQGKSNGNRVKFSINNSSLPVVQSEEEQPANTLPSDGGLFENKTVSPTRGVITTPEKFSEPNMIPSRTVSSNALFNGYFTKSGIPTALSLSKSGSTPPSDTLSHASIPPSTPLGSSQNSQVSSFAPLVVAAQDRIAASQQQLNDDLVHDASALESEVELSSTSSALSLSSAGSAIHSLGVSPLVIEQAAQRENLQAALAKEGVHYSKSGFVEGTLSTIANKEGVKKILSKYGLSYNKTMKSLVKSNGKDKVTIKDAMGMFPPSL